MDRENIDQQVAARDYTRAELAAGAVGVGMAWGGIGIAILGENLTPFRFLAGLAVTIGGCVLAERSIGPDAQMEPPASTQQAEG